MTDYIKREDVLRHKRKMSGADFGGEFWDEAVLCEDIRKIPTADVVEATKIKEAKLEIADRMDAFISGWLNISADTVNYWGGKVEAMTIAKNLVSSILTDLMDGTPQKEI
ncbi:MAG: hypothetical protein IKA41_08765 [Bacteroidaceae bacterium]|nr:hypothetical protein [Bacteroidaceae bacterium]